MKKNIPTLLVILFVVLAYFAFTEGKNSHTYSATTAVIALGFSLINFYVQHLWNVHKLSCTLISSSYGENGLKAFYTFENMGTHQELIIGGTFVFPKENTNEYSIISTSLDSALMPDMFSPFILKPKEIELKEFYLELNDEQLLQHLHINEGEAFKQSICLKLHFINPNTRRKASRIVECCIIEGNENHIWLSTLHTKQTELLEGELLNI